MSDQARIFLISWFSGHVKLLPEVRRLAEAVRLATKCRADAADVGISLDDIRDATDGDLILKLLQALDAVARLDGDTDIVPEMEMLIASETV
jgi:hypothetical protein